MNVNDQNREARLLSLSYHYRSERHQKEWHDNGKTKPKKRAAH